MNENRKDAREASEAVEREDLGETGAVITNNPCKGQMESIMKSTNPSQVANRTAHHSSPIRWTLREIRLRRIITNSRVALHKADLALGHSPPRQLSKGAPPSEDTKRLDWLLAQGNKEGHHGWSVMLRYDNYQDGAQILDADGKVVADCYELLVEGDGDANPIAQFRAAIDAAMVRDDAGKASAVLPPEAPREFSKGEESAAPPSATTKDKTDSGK